MIRSLFYLLVMLVALFIVAPLLMLMKEGMVQLPTAIQSKEVQFAIALSLKTSIISTIICLMLAAPIAQFLHQCRFKHYVMPFLYLPLALPHIVSGVALLLFFGHLGIGGFLERHFNLAFVFTEKGIMLAQVFVNLPFAIQLLAVGLERLNGRQLFVARTLGASKWQCFYHVTLPLLKSTLIATVILTWSRALGEFGAVIMVAGATRMKTEILPTSIMLNLSTGELDLAMAIAVILMMISLTCSLTFEYIFRGHRADAR